MSLEKTNIKIKSGTKVYLDLLNMSILPVWSVKISQLRLVFKLASDWLTEWTNQDQESDRIENLDTRLFGNMTKNGFLGDKMKNMVKIYSKIIPNHFSPRCDDFYDPYWYISSWRKQYSRFEMELKQNYNRHNQNVIDIVPKEDLLGLAHVSYEHFVT